MILVDTPRTYQTSLRHKTWSHMVTDGDRFDELHAMAKRIGLRREWFQGDHYDVTPPRREAAIKAGAVAVTPSELVVRRLRKDGTHGVPGTRSAKYCAAYEGCAGRGWLWDPTDSGSGATVYCDCRAGILLGAADAAKRANG